MADDAESLFKTLRARGWAEAEATARVREILLPGAEAREALRMLHRGPYQRFADRFMPSTMWRWERSWLACLGGVTLVISVVALRGAPLLEDPSPFLAPVVICGGAGLLFAVLKCLELFLKSVHTTDGLQRGLAPLLPNALSTVLMSVTGVCVDLYTLASRMEARHDPSGRMVLAFIRADGVLLAVGLTLALTIALAWFLLLQRVAVIEEADRDTVDVIRRLHGATALPPTGIPDSSEPQR